MFRKQGFTSQSRRASAVLLLVAGFFITVILWGFSRLPFHDDLERRTLDLRFRLFPTVESADDEIILVLLDGNSMDRLPWPVPRGLYADVLDILQDWGAKVVGFDILFDTPSVYSAMEDSIFGAAAADGNTCFVMALLNRSGSPIPENAIVPCTVSPGAGLDSAFFCTPPNSMIAAGATLLGSTNDVQDPDGVFRSVRLLTATPRGTAPSLPLAVAWLAEGRPSMEYSADGLSMGDVTIHTMGNCRLQLRFHGPTGTYRSFPLSDLTAALNARALGEPCPIDTSVFDNAIVLVGYAAPALYDLKPTPYSPQCPGVEVLATAADNILNGDSIVKYPGWVSFTGALLVSFFTALFLAFTKRIALGAAMAFLPTILFLGLSLLLFAHGYWLETIWPASAGILTILSGGILLFNLENRRKQEIRNAFSQYLSPAVVAQVTRDPGLLILGGAKRRMTVFFSDIKGFTTISEKLSPEELVTLLNRYLTRMTDLILETGGTVDKFEGDAIIAFWGAPIHFPDHAARACRTALLCQKAHGPMNNELTSDGFPELVTRIGLATGEMVVGNMGSGKRFDYTVMGSTVNLGSRLEGVNKVYGTSIIVSPDTVSEAGGEFIFRELDSVRVVGQKTPVIIYQLVCFRNEATPELISILEGYASALELYRKGAFREAAAKFMEHAEADRPSGVMAERCLAMAEDTGGKREDWDGVFDLQSK